MPTLSRNFLPFPHVWTLANAPSVNSFGEKAAGLTGFSTIRADHS